MGIQHRVVVEETVRTHKLQFSICFYFIQLCDLPLNQNHKFEISNGSWDERRNIYYHFAHHDNDNQFMIRLILIVPSRPNPQQQGQSSQQQGQMTQRPQHPTHNVHPTRPTHAPGNLFKSYTILIFRWYEFFWFGVQW